MPDRPSPLQNRVTPDGDLVAVAARGTLMGNRGCLHSDDGRLGVSRWRSSAWISCVLDWRGRHRDVMPPGAWTALFFADEVTALSAGHRPCGYCRRAEHRAFALAWQRFHGLAQPPRAAEIDRVLHAQRVEPGTRRKRTHPALVGDLPDGAMVRYADTPALVSAGRLVPWSFTGYGKPIAVPGTLRVALLTPPGIVGALIAGYRPIAQ